MGLRRGVERYWYRKRTDALQTLLDGTGNTYVSFLSTHDDAMMNEAITKHMKTGAVWVVAHDTVHQFPPMAESAIVQIVAEQFGTAISVAFVS
jgi:hypothetical protein